MAVCKFLRWWMRGGPSDVVLRSETTDLIILSIYCTHNMRLKKKKETYKETVWLILMISGEIEVN